MPKKVKKQRNTSSKESNRFKTEIYGLFLLAFSILVGFSIYIKPSGLIGIWIRNFFFALFGIGTYLIPIIMLIASVVFIANKGHIEIERKLVAILVFIFNIISMIHIGYSVSSGEKRFSSKLILAAEHGMEKKGGGISCEIIISPLIYMFGKVGAYIILICIGIVLAIIITEVSLTDLFKSIAQKVSIGVKQRLNDLKLKNNFNNQENNTSLEPKDLKEEKPQNLVKNANFDPRNIKIFDSLEDLESTVQSSIPPDITSTVKNQGMSSLASSEIRKESAATSIEVDYKEEKEYIFPDIKLLYQSKVTSNKDDKKYLLENAKMLEDTLQSFNVDAKVVQVRRGPSVTRYELHPSPGVKVSKIVNLSDDLALSLATSSVRIEAPIPGKAAVGIEVPNSEVSPVSLREVIESHEFTEFGSNLSFALGKDITGKCMVTDIGKMPHLLIAGATGSGKSVCINTLITSLIYKSSPDDVKMIMIDPKVVELSIYNGIPHLLIPVVTDPKKAASALYWAVNEMTDRYKIFAENNVRNIDGYNNLVKTKSIGKKMPKIVIIIDELADLMMVSPSDVEDSICRLSQMARAAGLHLVIATQRPSVDVITGVIKANIPSRISFAVSSQTDSRTILDMGGAEKLLGRGDMLFLPIGENKPIRVQGAFISEEEVESIVEFLKESSSVEYSSKAIEEIEKAKPDAELSCDEDDVLLSEAIKIAVDYGQASASMLQRRLRIGFNRAARLIEVMESKGIVGPQDGSKPRQVLISKEDASNL
ncbi:FtsK/SpoIIIE family DNA translocase [Clostridium cylindrosporum]|uniref:DNA translocase FtsK n=1 Tax=Clostridium cylindrosporum DSM 605 TaxID=1121307 RepID=A0A0J8G606_CLOCY|nr:DNA translocase FtsK [Clostridium cylindrosporum]KMT23051.1 DNA translocase FtsK [Clostridium cylindrosporum DSM 605]